jgi:rSAM/selenodomain-associated transferase 1
MIPDELLIIYAKAPVAGIAKTRLFPHVSFEEAAKLQEAMLADLVDNCVTLAGIGLWVCYTPSSSVGLFKDLLGDRTLEYRPQKGGDLGERMGRSFLCAFEEGAKRAVIVGTDVPSIPPEILCSAFHRLSEDDLVLGPAEDGGYYLIGLKRPAPGLFTGIEWSGGNVLDSTLDAAKRLGLKAALLPTLKDIDTFEDLREASLGPLPPRTEKVVSALMKRPRAGADWLL